MKPASFEYTAPATVQEAIQSLTSGGDSAKLLAGGQSLMPLLAMRLARPSLLVDLNRVGGLAEIRRDDGHLVVGAMTRIRALERDPMVQQLIPILSHMAGYIGHVTIRNRGTVGGSLAHADPAAELPLAMSVLGASFIVEGPNGSRTLSAEQFFESAMTTTLGSADVLKEIQVPISSPSVRSSFLELARRHGDFAIVAVLAMIELDNKGRCSSVRLGVAGAAQLAVRIAEAESLMTGEVPSDSLVAACARAAAQAVEPTSDLHGSAAYRREMVETLGRRALRAASGLE